MLLTVCGLYLQSFQYIFGLFIGEVFLLAWTLLSKTLLSGIILSNLEFFRAVIGKNIGKNVWEKALSAI